MAVYVDDYYAPFSRMKMSHMMADTKRELLAMADAIGVQRKWIQSEGTWREHFDVSMSKRKLAIGLGAKELTPKELVRLMEKKKDKL